MPKKQTTAGKKARAAARDGQKYTTALRRQLAPGNGPGAESHAPETNAVNPACLEHRSLLYHQPGFRPFRGTDLFERIGGQPTIDRLIDLLYEGFENDEQLRPLFPRGLADSRPMQKLFFAEWLGGPRRYSEQSHTGLKHRHDGLPVTSALASRWLGHFRRAMEATVAAEHDRRTIFAQVRTLALALVNEQIAPGGKVARGAAIDSSGSWIGASCTGNQGRKDDPEYVRALLHHGARANDRRTGDPEGTTGVRALNATALHYAARAGFLQTIKVLIDHGADPDARDRHGRTPLDWLEQAAPSVSRAAVRSLIAPRQHR